MLFSLEPKEARFLDVITHYIRTVANFRDMQYFWLDEYGKDVDPDPYAEELMKLMIKSHDSKNPLLHLIIEQCFLAQNTDFYLVTRTSDWGKFFQSNNLSVEIGNDDEEWKPIDPKKNRPVQAVYTAKKRD